MDSLNRSTLYNVLVKVSHIYLNNVLPNEHATLMMTFEGCKDLIVNFYEIFKVENEHGWSDESQLFEFRTREVGNTIFE